VNRNFLRLTLVNRGPKGDQPDCQLLRYINPVIVGGAIGRGCVLALFILPAFEAAPSIRVTFKQLPTSRVRRMRADASRSRCPVFRAGANWNLSHGVLIGEILRRSERRSEQKAKVRSLFHKIRAIFIIR
jgi:hypothetical protein